MRPGCRDRRQPIGGDTPKQADPTSGVNDEQASSDLCARVHQQDHDPASADRIRAEERLQRAAGVARGICHKHTTACDISQSAPDFRRNPSRRSNSKLSFAFGESKARLAASLHPPDSPARLPSRRLAEIHGSASATASLTRSAIFDISLS
jgi:hypothetical protein